MKKQNQMINPYVKKQIDDYVISQAIDKIFSIYVLYDCKGRSTYETFEEYMITILENHYGKEKYDVMYKKLVKTIDKKE